jgi:hypothetical protein
VPLDARPPMERITSKPILDKWTTFSDYILL